MLVNIGNDSYVNIEEVETVLPPESAPIKRMVGLAKDEDRCIDLTYGKRTKSVLVLRSGKLVLSSTMPATVVKNINKVVYGIK